MVPQLPASFYCQITDRAGTAAANIVPEWYIDGVPYREAIDVDQAMTGPATNFTISRLRVIRSPVPFIEVSCRPSLFPGVVYGRFQVGK